MRTNSDGSIDFYKKGVVYRFEKNNYDEHVAKRPRIASELNDIEKTILSPDCITQGPNVKNKRNFYRVLSYSDDRLARYLTLWKIPVYYKSKKLAIIATCIYLTSPNYYAVNDLENILWKKPNSQI